MTNREKMELHIRKAEAWQEQILSFETQALERAKTRDIGDQDPYYVAKRALDDFFPYNRAVANRNAHQAQANMYGIAAIVDAVSFPPKVVTE